MSDFKLEWYGDEVEDDIDRAVKQALRESGIHLSGESSEEAPRDKGDLAGDIHMDDDNIDELYVEVKTDLPYAIPQHENLSNKHKTGKAKYLEDPYNQNIDKYEKHIADAVDGATT